MTPNVRTEFAKNIEQMTNKKMITTNKRKTFGEDENLNCVYNQVRCNVDEFYALIDLERVIHRENNAK